MRTDFVQLLEDDLIERLREKGFEVVNAQKGGSLGRATLLWTFEARFAEAQKYQSRSAFQRGSKGAHVSAQKNGWFEEVCAHINMLRAPNGTWSKERCAEEAKRFASRVAFERGCSGAHNASLNGAWMDEISSHMEPLRTS